MTKETEAQSIAGASVISARCDAESHLIASYRFVMLALCTGGHTERLKAGDLYLIDSYQIHESCCSANIAYLCVHVLPTQMSKYVPSFDELRFSLQPTPDDLEKAEAFSTLTAHMQKLTLLHEEKPTGHLLRSYAILYGIVLLLLRFFSHPLVVEDYSRLRSDIARLEPILDYMELHHGEDLSLEQAASEMGLTKAYFADCSILYYQFTTFCAPI